MDVVEVGPGLWRWTAPHPDWTPEEGGDEGWEREVGCVYYEAGGTLVLFDPLAPRDEQDRDRFWRALDRDVERLGPPNVLLTVFWHARSAQEIRDRYEGARIFAHESARDRIGERVRFTDTFAVGDPLPGGVEAIDALRADEVLYWLPEHHALVCGDVLLGRADGRIRVCPDSWLPEGADPAGLRAAVRRVLDLPVERVLVSHGEPVLENGREALARALT